MNRKNKKKDKNDILLESMLFLFAVLILLGICILLFFKKYDTENKLNIVNYLEYIGSFGGAILSSGVSFIILSLTIIFQRRDIEKQRQIDKNTREEERKQFEKDYNIKIINDKLDNYKNIYLKCINIIQATSSILDTNEEIHECMINNETRRLVIKDETYDYLYKKIIKLADILTEFEFECTLIEEKELPIKYDEILELGALLSKNIPYFSLVKDKDELDSVINKIEDVVEKIAVNIRKESRKLVEEKYK